MYGIGPHTIVGGGAAGGVLAYTGFSMVEPTIIAAVCLMTGVLLLIRAHRLAPRSGGSQ